MKLLPSSALLRTLACLAALSAPLASAQPDLFGLPDDEQVAADWPAQSIEQKFTAMQRQLAASSASERESLLTRRFAVLIDAGAACSNTENQNQSIGQSAEPRLQYDAASGRFDIFYHMNFNQIAEGWSWQPLANPRDSDYYRFQYLPLDSFEREEGPRYMAELFTDVHKEVRRLWRHDYFLAFDNGYDFYNRPDLDDDTGFHVTLRFDPQNAADAATALRLQQPGAIRTLAIARWQMPYQSESSTYWHATLARPVDLMLRKHYLIGKLEQLWFYDATTGRPLARLLPRNTALQQKPAAGG